MTCTRVDFSTHSPLGELIFIRHLLHARLCSEADVRGLISSLPQPGEESVIKSKELEQVCLTPSPTHGATLHTVGLTGTEEGDTVMGWGGRVVVAPL